MLKTKDGRVSIGLMSSKTDKWNTPSRLLEEIRIEFGNYFDPCPPNASFDGLCIPWIGLIYCNPPYGRAISKWLKKGADEIAGGRATKIVWLLPARTDTRWFHEVVYPLASEIRFIRGRLHFNDGPQGAPFPSMIVVWK